MSEVQDNTNEEEVIGKCPKCGADVVENQRAFGCSKWRREDGGCRFTIWKTISGKEITKEIAKELLENKKTAVMSGFTSHAGRPFSAALIIKEDGSVGFEFPPRK